MHYLLLLQVMCENVLFKSHRFIATGATGVGYIEVRLVKVKKNFALSLESFLWILLRLTSRFEI